MDHPFDELPPAYEDVVDEPWAFGVATGGDNSEGGERGDREGDRSGGGGGDRGGLARSQSGEVLRSLRDSGMLNVSLPYGSSPSSPARGSGYATGAVAGEEEMEYLPLPEYTDHFKHGMVGSYPNNIEQHPSFDAPLVTALF